VKTRKEAPLRLEPSGNGVRLTVKVVPGSSRSGIAGLWEGSLKVKIAAPPEKGKANQMLLELLGGVLGVRKNQMTILAGLSSPVKTLHIAEVTAEQVYQALEQECGL
jgi:hypothetical protein